MALENVMAVDNGKILGLHSETAANVPYDNTESGLSSINVQDAVDEVSERVGSHTFGTGISLTTTDYVTLSDGYVVINLPVSGRIGFVMNNMMVIQIATTNDRACIFVRKGTPIRLTNVSGGDGTFYPLQ